MATTTVPIPNPAPISDLTARPSWLQSIIATFKDRTGTWLVAVIFAIMTIFSDRVTESIKFGLNRADNRVKQYESLCAELSSYISKVEWVHEFLSKAWTTELALKELIPDYNKSITSLRSNEYVYLAWLHRYWDKNKEEEFHQIMTSIKGIDTEIHGLNDEFELVINSTKKTNEGQR